MKVVVKPFSSHTYGNAELSEFLDANHDKHGYDIQAVSENYRLTRLNEILGKKSNLSKYRLYRIINKLIGTDPAFIDYYAAIIASFYKDYKESRSEEFNGKIIIRGDGRLIGHLFEDNSLIYFIPKGDVSKQFRIDSINKLFKLL